MTNEESQEVFDEINEEEVLDSVSLNTVENKEEEVSDEQEDDNNQNEDYITVDTNKTNMPDEEIDDETMELYNDFNSFIKQSADMDQSVGEKIVIPTGIDLIDAILGGGFAVGCLNIIVGQPGGGKTMLASRTIGNGQKVYKGKILSGFLDAEEAMTAKRLYDLGVTYPKIKPYSDITVEKVFKYLEGTCVFKKEKKILDVPSIVVWDSIANTLSEKEREAEDVNSVIGYKARMLSMLVPKYVSKCSEHNICLLAINQLRDKLQMGMFSPAPDLKFMGAQKDMPGGNSLKFNAFQLVSVNIKTAIDTNKPECKYPFDGFISKIKCVKNKLFSPNVEVEAIADFYHGFSNFWTNYKFLADSKRLKTGSWNYLVDDPTQKKFRTRDAEDMYKNDETFRELFDRIAKDAIKTDIIDKYNE